MVTRDQLFATLDPTVRRIRDLPGTPVLVSDTVGFLRDLPHELIAAFRATLEETVAASLVVHVIDAAAADRDQHIAAVEQVLAEIGADRVPLLKVFNKIDRAGVTPGQVRDADGQISQVWLSARTGQGLDGLREALAERLGQGRIRRWIDLPADRARLRARLFALGAVREEHIAADGSSHMAVDLARRDADQLCHLGGLDGPVAAKLLLN